MIYTEQGSANLTTSDVTATDATALPSGWSNADIGSVAAAGTSKYSNLTFTIDGSGADIWGSADEFHFAYRPWTGDGTIVARVATLENVSQWTKAGVMMREALTASSRHAMMIVSPGKGLAFQRRVSTGGLSTHTSGGSGTAPHWVRLVRNGSTLTASVSSDGLTWTVVGSDTIGMTETIYVGLAVTSKQDGTLATATFDNVNVTAP